MSVLDRRIRGFRLVDLVAAGLLVVLILGVYLAKTMAGRERAEIARVERQIGEEKTRIRLLQAEVAHLEEPARLERLSTAYLGMTPAPIRRAVTLDSLPEIAKAPVIPEKHPEPAAPQAPFDPTRVHAPEPAEPAR
jgi:cell division protein FtsL